MTADAQQFGDDAGEPGSLPCAIVRPPSVWRVVLLRLMLFTAAGVAAGLVAGWLASDAPGYIRSAVASGGVLVEA